MAAKELVGQITLKITISSESPTVNTGFYWLQGEE